MRTGTVTVLVSLKIIVLANEMIRLVMIKMSSVMPFKCRTVKIIGTNKKKYMTVDENMAFSSLP